MSFPELRALQLRVAARAKDQSLGLWGAGRAPPLQGGRGPGGVGERLLTHGPTLAVSVLAAVGRRVIKTRPIILCMDNH